MLDAFKHVTTCFRVWEKEIYVFTFLIDSLVIFYILIDKLITDFQKHSKFIISDKFLFSA